MPLVKIEIEKGRDDEYLYNLQKQTMNSIVKALCLAEDDRNIRLIEYESRNFNMKDPYKIIIEITMFSGRSEEAKKNLFSEIVNNLSKHLSINPTEVFIVINEQPKYNWGIRGGIPASEIALDFKVNI